MADVVVVQNADVLALRAASDFAASAAQAIADRGRFNVALAGGSTPEKTYGVLATAPFARTIEWARVHVFFGDERDVPYDDSRSNYGMAHRALLELVPEVNVHPAPVDKEPEQNAEAYEAEMRQEIGGDVRFDLILLGLGDDGHTASLFPGMSTLKVSDRLVVPTVAGTLPPPVDRVTFTFPLINAARSVVFLVAGAAKAAVVKDVLEGTFTIDDRPAVGVRPVDGTLTWLLDAAAASQLEP